MKEEVRPIYNELQGYLSQAPNKETQIADSSIGEQYNKTIEELNAITGRNYNRFKVDVQNTNIPGVWANRRQIVSTQSYRTNLSGLISRLYSEYFLDEKPPFSTVPNTIITQQQSQNQTTYIQILLDVQSKIDEKLREYKDGSKEKTFLEKIKSSLSGTNNILELIKLILKTAVEIGLTIEQVLKLL